MAAQIVEIPQVQEVVEEQEIPEAGCLFLGFGGCQ